jgi:hypothetical protein
MSINTYLDQLLNKLIAVNGVPLPARPYLNFIGGTGAPIDNPGFTVNGIVVGSTDVPLTSLIWTPALQTGLLGWGRADQGLTNAGGNITGWADITSNGSNMVLGTGAGADPQLVTSNLSGQPAVRMQTTGGNAWLTGTLGAHFSGTAITIIVIGNIKYSSAARVISAFPSAGNDTNANAFTLYQSSSTILTLYNAGSIATVTTGDRTSGLAGVYSARFDGAHGTARFNGTDGSPGACATTFSLDKFDFSDVNGLDNPFDVCEWAIVNHALSAAELALWSQYTTFRYGIAT